ncbi:hypothetical protein [Thalassobacillus sp. C254]|nr:hypothetical protein [Thalassobacillus sp. C254]
MKYLLHVLSVFALVLVLAACGTARRTILQEMVKETAQRLT